MNLTDILLLVLLPVTGGFGGWWWGNRGLVTGKLALCLTGLAPTGAGLAGVFC